MPIDDNELDTITGTHLHTPVAPVCPQCRYNLTGLADPICPECGYRFNWRTVRRKARNQWLEALGLKTLPEEIEFGFWITCASWGMAVLVNGGLSLLKIFHIMSLPLYWILIVLGIVQLLMAFCGAFLCAHILKYRQVPEEVRESLGLDVPTGKAWIGLIASSILLVIGLPMCVRIIGS